MQTKNRQHRPQESDVSSALREYQERFDSFIELSSEGYWEQDENYRFTLITAGTLGRSGIDPKTYLGTTRWDHGAVPVGDGGSWDAHKAMLEARQPFTDFVMKRSDVTGGTRYISASGQPVFDERGRFRGYRGITRDITRRRREELFMRLEHSVTRCLGEAENVASGIEAVVRAVCETQDWDCGRHFRVDESAGVMRFAGAWGVPGAPLERIIEESRGVTYTPGKGLTGKVWESGHPLWVNDIASDSRVLKGVVRALGMRGTFIFPLTTRDKIMGVLMFHSRAAREPDERLLQAVKVIGSQVGQFLQRKQAERVLRESEENFRALTELSSDLYWMQDSEHRFKAFTGSNKTVPSRLIGKHRWDEPAVNMTEADWAAHKAVMDARQTFRDVELGRKTPTGETYWVAISGAPVFDDSGNFVGYRGLSKNITARKRSELMQSLEHAVTRSLAEAENPADALTAVIRAVCEALDWDCGRYFMRDAISDALTCTAVWGVVSPEIQAFIDATRGLTLPPGQGLAGEVLRSGAPIWVPDITKDPRAMRTAQQYGLRGTFAFPVTSQGEVIGVLAFNSREGREPEKRLVEAVGVIGSQVGQFVRRARAEGRIRESEERFRSMTELASDIYWEQDASYRFTLVSHTGMDWDASDDSVGKTLWELHYINMTPEQWAAHIAVLDARKPFRDLELCRTDQAGSLRWISISGEPTFDAAGKLSGYRGVGRDITARKRAEQLQTLEHAVTRALAQSDTAGAGLKSVMRAVCEMLGWECGRYFAMDQSGGVLRLGECWYVPSAALERFIAYSAKLTFTPGTGVVGKAAAGEPQWVADVGNDSRVVNQMMADDHGMRGAFMFPVISEGAALGVLSFTSRVIREPDERLLQAVRVIGAQVGQFLQRKKTEEVLRESEERFRSLTELSSDMYWEQDEQFRFTSFSGMGSQRVNVNTLKYVGKKRWEQNYVNMTADDWAQHIAVLEAHQPFRDMELCRVDDQGRKIWISISGEPVFDASGAFKGYRGVGKDITERKLDEEHIQFLANHDALTALPNRAMFTEVLNLAIENARRYRRHFAVLFIDLDRFKIINDTLGHEAGDKLLQEMSKRLTHTVRASDVVARLGGDEFVVLVQEVAEPKQVATVARKILASLVQPVVMNQQEVRMTASIGICMYPADAQDEQSLMKNADIAMYRAKEDGKNNYKFYSEEINVHSFEKLALETSLRRGLERNEFLLHYQAKLDLKTGAITGVEALLRWNHPDLGMVPPGQFIPLAEETGLIVPIGKWVLETACAQVVEWEREGLPRVHMAVNLSARQFADDNLVSDVQAAILKTGIASDLLELELTESMVIQNTERAGRVLADIKRLGVRLAIDDFGVGYSSLSHLKRFPIDTLKVDRSFIRDIPQDAEDKAITEAIIAMGKSLSLTVVAEGVETAEQQDFLRQHACDEMQGFLFSKPVPPEQFAELARRTLVDATR
ncbi:MAG TPA: EAL domain-containing protein [Burkholderiales bacterium]|nr:EAL domain-containing protein [Burkholderiales bacterium]